MHRWDGKEATHETGGCGFESSRPREFLLLWVAHLVPVAATGTNASVSFYFLRDNASVSSSGQWLGLYIIHGAKTPGT